MKKRLRLNRETLRLIAGQSTEIWPGEPPNTAKCKPIVETFGSCRNFYTWEDPSCIGNCSGMSCCTCPGEC